MDRVRFLAVALMIILAGAWPIPVNAQTQEETLSARNIRARKLAQHWQGEQIQLTLTDGRQLVGEFIGADFYSFTLDRKQKQVVIPIEQVATVTLKPGLMEAGLTIMSGILGGALGAGIVS
ncbi:MAG: hypothetical protein JSU61_08775, partial [Fidelibacterota bacterium]